MNWKIHRAILIAAIWIAEVLLGNGGLHHLAGQDQIHGGGVAVEADDNHVVHAGGLAGVHGADSGIVIVAEHDVDQMCIRDRSREITKNSWQQMDSMRIFTTASLTNN